MSKIHSALIRSGLMTALLTIGLPTAEASMGTLVSSIESRQYTDAYKQAQQMVDQHAGNPRFDYLLGMAALHTGNVSEAVFALERVTLMEPNNMMAQLALGESYLRVGQYTEGEQTLNDLLYRQPPQDIATRASQLLKYKTAGTRSNPKTFKAFVDMAGGNDTNINSAAEVEGPVITPLGLVVSLDPSSTAIEDSFMQYSLGAAGVLSSGSINTAAGISVRNRQNSEYDAYDSTVVTSYIGIDAGGEHNRLYIPVYHQDFNLAGNDYYTYTVAGLAWRYYYDKKNYLSLFADVGTHVYDVLSQLDGKTTTYGFDWKHQYTGGAVNSKISLYGGNQEPDSVVAGVNDFFARDFSGLSATIQGVVAASHAPYLTARFENSEYGDAVYPSFGEYRKDEYQRYAIGWRWSFSKQFLVRIEYADTRNVSNIPIMEYDRTLYMLGLRYTY